nr:hypothetical protein [uncultured Noviherbaspirillum sp.]
MDGTNFTAAFAEHHPGIDRCLHMNQAIPLLLPTTEAFLTLPASWESTLPPELGNLIVRQMVALGPDQDPGCEGLKSLVIANDIVKQRHCDENG